MERGFQSWCLCVPALALRTGRALPQPSTGQLWPCKELGSCPGLQDLVLTDSGQGSLQPSLGSSGNHCSPCQLGWGTATARLPKGATGAAHCPIPGAVWAAPLLSCALFSHSCPSHALRLFSSALAGSHCCAKAGHSPGPSLESKGDAEGQSSWGSNSDNVRVVLSSTAWDSPCGIVALGGGMCKWWQGWYFRLWHWERWRGAGD